MAFKANLPQLLTVIKWTFLIVIAVTTALVGLAQSVLVSWLYKTRSGFIYGIVQMEEDWVKKFFQFTGFNLLLAFLCCMSLFLISPAASGSGIPDVKAYLNGVEHPIFKNFFTVKTFVAKVLGSAFAVASSLVMGKEGPMLHAGSILAVILGSSKWFQRKIDKSAHWGSYMYHKDVRDLVACGAACGVCAAFKAPVGGVMFAMEMSTRWSKQLTWRCFLAAAVCIVVVRFSVEKCVEHGHCSYLSWASLIGFNLTFPTPYEQAWAMILLAVIGGYLGCLFTTFNTWVCLVRKRWSKYMWARVLEVCIISVITSTVRFVAPAMGTCMPCETTDNEHCVSGSALFHTFRGYGCPAGTYNDMAVLVFNPQGFLIQALFTAHAGAFALHVLFAYSGMYWVLAAITYGAFIPSGLFTPSLIFGGCLGRIYADLLVRLGMVHQSHVGMYALLGAASFLGGLMRMSASMCLILMEMTASPRQLPFLMMVLVIAKSVGDAFNYSVFDHQLMLKGLPFVGYQAETVVRRAHLDANIIMAKPDEEHPSLGLVESGDRIMEVLDRDKTVNAFPVMGAPSAPGARPNFMGIISRGSLWDLIREHGETCDKIDITTRVEIPPLVVPPSMPLDMVYAVVTTMGLEYLPVVAQLGPLEGLISRQDLVDVENKKLDRFHIKEHIQEAAHDIAAGNIIRSMQLEHHTSQLRNAVLQPIRKARGVILEGAPIDEEEERAVAEDEARRRAEDFDEERETVSLLSTLRHRSSRHTDSEVPQMAQLSRRTTAESTGPGPSNASALLRGASDGGRSDIDGPVS